MQWNRGILLRQRRQNALFNQHLTVKHRHAVVIGLFTLCKIEGNPRRDRIGRFLIDICPRALLAVDVFHILLAKFEARRRPVIGIVRLCRRGDEAGIFRARVHNRQKAILPRAVYHRIDGHERLRLRAGGVVRSAGQRFDAVIPAIDARGVGRAVISGLAVADKRAAAVGKQDVAVHGVRIGTAKEGQKAHGFEKEALVALDEAAVHQLQTHTAARPRDLHLKGNPLLGEVYAAKETLL